MSEYFTTLGSGPQNTPVRVVAPGIQEFDLFDMPDEHRFCNLWGLDVESTSLGDGGHWREGFTVRTIQLAPADDCVYVLRMDDPWQVLAAKWILEQQGNTFISHTQMDVLAVRQALGVDISARNIDTHVLAVMSAPDDARGQAELKPVAARFGMPQLAEAEEDLDDWFGQLWLQAHPDAKRKPRKLEVKKWGFDNAPTDHQKFVTYAGLDAVVVRRLMPMLVAQTRAPRHLLRTERWLSTQAIRLRERGHLVDVEQLEKVEANAREIEKLAAEQLMDVCGLKTTQNVALVRWLTDQGIDWTDHPVTATGAPSLAKDHIPGLLARGDHSPEIRYALDAFLKSAKVLDRIKRCTEIRAVKDRNNRVHPTLVSVGTVTGRMAASAPNMQNFSKKDPVMRGLFIPEPDHLLLSCDFAQIELRVIAALSGELKMIETILSGGDLHQLTADLLAITRQHAKTVNFLIVYGGGAARLAAQLAYERSVNECKQIIQRYWRQYPKIHQLANQMSNQMGLRLISGRYVPTGHYKNGGPKTSANLNYLIQGSSRELLVGAWRRFASTPAREAMVWFPIHDELVLQVPADFAEDIAHDIGQAMSFDFYGVPVRADADILIDEHGVSRWMSGDHAKAIRAAQAAA